MDVMDAGAWVAKWEADVPPLQTVLWGPLQAREMGFDGWEWQDGGETGFIAHNKQIRLPAGFATSTLIVQNRLRKAFLTIYLGGYPANVPSGQRRLDQEKVMMQAQAILARLAKKPVELRLMGEITLVDSVNDATVDGGMAQAIDPPVEPPQVEAVQNRDGVWEV